MAIYERRLDDKALEAEDHLLLALLHHRQGRAKAAARESKKVLEAGLLRPQSLEELARLQIDAHLWDDAIQATERLSGQPGWEARGSMMLGAIRLEFNNVAGAADSFRHAIELDAVEIDKSPDPTRLRKVIARTFLQMARPAEARNVLQPILERGPDQETNWLLSRVYLQQRRELKTRALQHAAGNWPVRIARPIRSSPSRAHSWVRLGASSATRPFSAIRSPAGIRRPTTVVHSSGTSRSRTVYCPTPTTPR